MKCKCIFPIVLAVALIVSVYFNVRSCTNKPQEVVTDSVVTIIVHEKTDTMPVESKPEKVIGYVTGIALPQPVVEPQPMESDNDSVPDGVAEEPQPIPVVQRTYSDDSTYTAWVSGVKYGQYPKLDSIRVRERTIIKEYSSKPPDKRWHVGVTAGYGIGKDKTMQPYIGISIMYSFFSF